MRFYRKLKNNVFHENEYRIEPIRTEDRFEIMRWRNEQIYHLRQKTPLTAIEQDKYFKEVVDKLFDQDQPDQILFSYLERDRCIGYGGLVHINWTDRNAEISFIMDTAREEVGFFKHWTNFLILLERVAFAELALHKIYTYAFDLRPKLYDVVESNGFFRDATLKEHCLYSGRFKDVVIHSKINKS